MARAEAALGASQHPAQGSSTHPVRGATPAAGGCHLGTWASFWGNSPFFCHPQGSAGPPAGPAATGGGRGGGNLSCKGRQQALAFCDGNETLQEQKANVLRVAAKTSAGDIWHLIYGDIFYAEMEESSCYLYKQN